MSADESLTAALVRLEAMLSRHPNCPPPWKAAQFRSLHHITNDAGDPRDEFDVFGDPPEDVCRAVAELRNRLPEITAAVASRDRLAADNAVLRAETAALREQVGRLHEAAAGGRTVPLFRVGDFTLASGRRSRWKIECDALTTADWDGLARMAADVAVPPFGAVLGVPRGGMPFAASLVRFLDRRSDVIVIAEDVVTTGGSITRYRETVEQEFRSQGRRPPGIVGVCVFARGSCPEWVTPLFRMPEARP